MIMKLSTFGASASPSGVTATVTFAWPMRDLRSWGVQELSAGKWDAPPRITTGRLGDTQSLITGMTSMGKLRPTYRTREQMEHCEVRALKSQGRAPSPPCKIWILKNVISSYLILCKIKHCVQFTHHVYNYTPYVYINTRCEKYTLCVKLHTMCKITHCVQNYKLCAKLHTV